MHVRLALTVAVVFGLAAAVVAATAPSQAESAGAAGAPLTVAEIETMLDAPGAHDPFEPDLPLGLLPESRYEQEKLVLQPRIEAG